MSARFTLQRGEHVPHAVAIAAASTGEITIEATLVSDELCTTLPYSPRSITPGIGFSEHGQAFSPRDYR